MDELINMKGNVIVQDDDIVEVLSGKVLNIHQSMPDVDFRGIINKVSQYIMTLL